MQLLRPEARSIRSSSAAGLSTRRSVARGAVSSIAYGASSRHHAGIVGNCWILRRLPLVGIVLLLAFPCVRPSSLPALPCPLLASATRQVGSLVSLSLGPASQGMLVSPRRTTAVPAAYSPDGPGLHRQSPARLTARHVSGSCPSARTRDPRFLSDPASRQRPCAIPGPHLFQAAQGHAPQAGERCSARKRGSGFPLPPVVCTIRDRRIARVAYA